MAKLKCLCIVCSNKYTNHIILHEEKNSYHEHETGWWEERKFQVIQCAGCDEISFRSLYNDAAREQNLQLDEDPWLEELFPKRTIYTRIIKPTRNVPQILTSIYRETIDAFNNSQYILCAAGIRALIEGICKEKGIIGKEVVKGEKIVLVKTLAAKIDGLSINRYLSEENSNALHELRFMGNDAIHELVNLDRNELIVALDVVDLTLINIYELYHKTRSLNRAKEARKQELDD